MTHDDTPHPDDLPELDPQETLGETIYEERLNGADLYFEVVEALSGEPNAPTVVYLHGGPGYNASSFRAALGDVLGGYRMVYLDQRGGGRSGPLADTDQGDETLDIDTLVDDLEALRDRLELDTFTPLGHGFGALVALEYARRWPQHTERAVVVGPWVHFPDLALTLLSEASALRGEDLDDPAEELQAASQDEHPPIGEARLERAFGLVNGRDLLNAMQFSSPATRMRQEFLDTEGQLLGGGEVQQAFVNQGMWSFEYPHFLTEIRRPIYVIVGAQDRTSYPEQTTWLEDLGGADVTVVPGGHYPWLDDEEEFLSALERAVRG
jgi:proline iminopeptidase